MAKERKHYEILIEGDGRGNFPAQRVNVYCTEEEVQIVGGALASYVLNYTNGGCCCIAKENGGVTHNNFDLLFSDCM